MDSSPTKEEHGKQDQNEQSDQDVQNQEQQQQEQQQQQRQPQDVEAAASQGEQQVQDDEDTQVNGRPQAPSGRKLDVQRVELQGNQAEFLESCSTLDMRSLRTMVENQSVDPSQALDSVGQNCLHFVASSLSDRAVQCAAAVREESERQTQLVGYLSSRGADPNCKRSSDGWTPLHVAAILKRVDLVRALLNAGARADVGDHDGKTPEDWAARYRLEEVRNILLHR